MPDPGQPSFSEVFDDTLFAEPAPAGAGHAVRFDPAEVFAAADGASVGSLVEGRDRQPRFDGDTSELPPEVCWALQELVAAPHVSSKSGKNWPVVLQYERELRSRLPSSECVVRMTISPRRQTYRCTDWWNDTPLGNLGLEPGHLRCLYGRHCRGVERRARREPQLAGGQAAASHPDDEGTDRGPYRAASADPLPGRGRLTARA